MAPPQTRKAKHHKAAKRTKLRTNATVKKKAGAKRRSGNRPEKPQSAAPLADMLGHIRSTDNLGPTAAVDTLDARSLVEKLKQQMKNQQQKQQSQQTPSTENKKRDNSSHEVRQRKQLDKKNSLVDKADGDDETNKTPLSLALLDVVEAIPVDKAGKQLTAELIEKEKQDAQARCDAMQQNGQTKNFFARSGPAYAFWDGIGVHELLRRGLERIRFTHPTPVQSEAIPSALEQLRKASQSDGYLNLPNATLKAYGRELGQNKLSDTELEALKSKGEANANDTALATENESKKNSKHLAVLDHVVAAETGSGKTLVFCLPIVQSAIALELAHGGLKEVINSRSKTEEDEEAIIEDELHLVDEEEDVEAEDEEEEDEELEEDQEEEDPVIPDATQPLKGILSTSSKILHKAMDQAPPIYKRAERVNGRTLHALILTPTRELALQITQCLRELTYFCRGAVRIACLVGGMAPEKQQRLLNQEPDILVCTPGRMWDLVQKNEGAFLGHSISQRLNFLVLDEADRLTQAGKFEDLTSIIERVRCNILPSGAGEEVLPKGKRHRQSDDDDDMDDSGEEGEWDEEKQKFIPKRKAKPAQTESTAVPRDRPIPMAMPAPPGRRHRTVLYLTSATLSLQVNFHNKNKNQKRILRTQNADTMGLVLKSLGVNEKFCRITNLSPEQSGLVQRIEETYLRCPDGSKDLYCYYFCRTFRGRKIIFVNAISMLRRLVKLLELLEVPVGYLHAAMQQRARLKAIDRFRKGERPVLVATDVAARGLDVENVRHIVHYQLPRSTDSYIHRSGRTARCGDTGFSVMFVGPADWTAFQKLLSSMNRDRKQLDVFTVNETALKELHRHLKLAQQVDKLLCTVRKKDANQNWVKATALGAELDADDMLFDDETRLENRTKVKQAKALQKQLTLLLRKSDGFRNNLLDESTENKAAEGKSAASLTQVLEEKQLSKGAFRSNPRAIGAAMAVSNAQNRAVRQVTGAAKEEKEKMQLSSAGIKKNASKKVGAHKKQFKHRS